MNTVAVTVPSVKPVLFKATSPFQIGVQDAAAGFICCPEMYFSHRLDRREYAAGWASIKGQNETTRYFLGGKR